MSFETGDTFLARIRFENNQALELIEWNDEDSFELTKLSFWFEDSSQDNWLISGMFTFVGVGGDLLANDWAFTNGGSGGMLSAPFTRRNLTDSYFFYTGIDILSNFDSYEVTSGPGIFDRIEYSAGADDVRIIDVSSAPQPVPEPSTIALLGIGIISLAGFSWKKSKK